MSQYLVLIYEDESSYAAASEQEMGEVYQAHVTFQEIAGDALAGGNALQPTGTATSIRASGDGDFTVTDGPFAEAKEALGGYYLLEAPDLDAAIALAKQVPAKFGGVEVRPIMVFE
ncbi:YciI family protein [Nocardia sp. NPDC050710]|uniref:YciI family protein n=1 Tax=Nocardia sp. NPDC050710 TaxID=3157220 RepID=UPI0033FB7C45